MNKKVVPCNIHSLPILNLGNSRLPFKRSMTLLILASNKTKNNITNLHYSLGLSMDL